MVGSLRLCESVFFIFDSECDICLTNTCRKEARGEYFSILSTCRDCMGRINSLDEGNVIFTNVKFKLRNMRMTGQLDQHSLAIRIMFFQ